MFTKRVQQNAAKAIIWLTVAMFALPATPVSACPCSTGAAVSECDCCCQLDHNQPNSQSGLCSTKKQHACCSEFGNTLSSCCNNGLSTAPCEGCSCENSCSCKSGQLPSLPANPLRPVEDSPNKVSGDDFHADMLMPIAHPVIHCNQERCLYYDSLDRCIALSRFIV